jgi:hypothetical protein
MGQEHAALAVSQRRLQLKTYPAAATSVQSREADCSWVELPFFHERFVGPKCVKMVGGWRKV